MDRKTAESLLADLLSAAKAPGTERELAGEAAAMAAFRAAAHSPAPARRGNPLLKLLTVKVVAVAFATTATVGGVALAASTGALPNPISAPSSAEPSPSPPAATSRSPHAEPSRTPPQGTGTETEREAEPHRSLGELCREFGERDRDGRRRALDDDRFGDLVRRAGEKDRDRVERFCSGLRRPAAGPSGSVRPGFGTPRQPDSDDDRYPGDGHENDRDRARERDRYQGG
ncbi:hypothetical protein [Actinoplanes sp. NPDC023714]|uniref:hypothetical protein n=1 Tax=Actinoplanes sp. NPDC023714 TaxID=3154322 RepID=UPI0033F3D2EB